MRLLIIKIILWIISGFITITEIVFLDYQDYLANPFLLIKIITINTKNTKFNEVMIISTFSTVNSP